jgi:hypothetical protein
MKYAVFAFVALSALPAHAASITCPAQIQVREQADAQTPWRPFIDKVNARHFLSHVDLYDGPPEGLAQLKPDNADTDDKDPSYWSVDASNTLYVACNYQDTSVKYVRALPRAEKRCTVTYADNTPTGIDCE